MQLENDDEVVISRWISEPQWLVHGILWLMLVLQ